MRDYLERFKLAPVDAEVSDPDAELYAALDRHNAELETIKKQTGSLHDLLEQGVYSVETYLERQQALSERKEEITAQIDSIQKKLDNKRQRMSRERFIPQLEHVLDVYWTLDDAAEKNALLKTVLEKCVYQKEKKGIHHMRDYELTLYPLVR